MHSLRVVTGDDNAPARSSSWNFDFEVLRRPESVKPLESGQKGARVELVQSLTSEWLVDGVKIQLHDWNKRLFPSSDKSKKLFPFLIKFHLTLFSAIKHILRSSMIQCFRVVFISFLFSPLVKSTYRTWTKWKRKENSPRGFIILLQTFSNDFCGFLVNFFLIFLLTSQKENKRNKFFTN